MTLSETVQVLGVAEFKARLIAELKSLCETHQDFRYVTRAQLLKCGGGSPKCSYARGPEIGSIDDFGASVYTAFDDNTEEQNKGCLFGRALAALGIDVSNETENIGYLLRDAGVCALFSSKCWDFQSEQDGGCKWGDLNISSLDRL
jgi:hypothetical protein